METTNKSLVERENEVLSAALQEIKPQMDAENKAIVARKVKKTVRVIELYLGGYVGKKQTAKEIIEACRKNILDREQKLSEHAA
jgi:ribosomal protein S7